MMGPMMGVVLAIAFSTSLQARGFQLLPEGPWGTHDPQVAGVSGTGTVVIGHFDTDASNGTVWRWTPSGGYSFHNRPSGVVNVMTRMAISADGKVMAGTVVRGFQGGRSPVAWRWTASGGMEELGVVKLPIDDDARMLRSHTGPIRHELSADGSTLLIAFDDSFGLRRAFVWRRETGFAELTSLFPTSGSGLGMTTRLSRDGTAVLINNGIEDPEVLWTATSGLLVGPNAPAGYRHGLATMSSNGRIIVGTWYDPQTDEGTVYRWGADRSVEILATLQTGFWEGGAVDGVPDNGEPVVGRQWIEENGIPRLAPWRWTFAEGIQFLVSPEAPAHLSPGPIAVTADGSVFFGDGMRAPGAGLEVWRWTSTEGLTWIRDDFAPATDALTEYWLATFVYHRPSGDHGSVDGTVLAGSTADGLPFIAAYRPVIERIWPADGVSGYGDMEVTVYGLGFEPGSVVVFGGMDLDTTYVNSTRLDVTIPESALAISADFSVVSVRVRCPDGEISRQAAFTVVNPDLDEFWSQTEAAVVDPGQSASVEVLPTDSDSAGISATLVNGTGSEPATVLVATYVDNPTPTSTFDAGGGYVDLQVTGASADAQLTAYFYYPSSITGDAEAELVLMYFDGANWVTVLSSGGTSPVQDTEQKRFTVVFDSTSTPAITEIGGTIFGVADGAPAILRLTAPSAPNPVGGMNLVEVEYSSPSPATILVDWGDGTIIVADGTAPGLAQAAHAYGEPGVYTVFVTLTDLQGRVAKLAHQYIVIYDPNGGFVTGGGWIESSPGAYPADPTKTGKATFGFNSKYQKGKTLPSGDTQFQFQAAGFRFHSTAYEWLVVSGDRAQYKGVGKVNNAGDYGFLLTATDGQVNGGGGTDRFRIKIWDRASGVIVYDNVLGASDDFNNASPQILGGGSIVIHQSK